MNATANVARQVVALGRLSQLELDIRKAESPAALAYMAVNDTHKVVAYEHALVWLAADAAIVCVSGGLQVDPRAPQIAWYGKVAMHLARTRPDAGPVALETSVLPADLRDGGLRWQLPGGVWIPFVAPRSGCLGALLVHRAVGFNEAELRVLERLGSAYGTAFAAHLAPHARSFRPGRWRARLFSAAAAIAALAAMAIPVRLVALVDAKVVPIAPIIVSAPIDGIIERILVQPNEAVGEGRPLVLYDRTELTAAEDIAARRVSVLAADRRRAEAQGLANPKARAELGMLIARQAEGEVELTHARHRLARSRIVAPSAGIALVDDPLLWQGKPVRVGERLLAIANPDKVRLEIHLPVEDALVASLGSTVEFFQASSPMTPVAARIVRISHEARVLPSQMVAFVADAEIELGAGQLRLGLTGTAKIYGERAPLGYLLLRKPLAAARRLLGL